MLTHGLVRPKGLRAPVRLQPRRLCPIRQVRDTRGRGGTSGRFQGGVLAGPLYNGQDYLGTDPDPNIRAYILKDLGSRYGAGR